MCVRVKNMLLLKLWFILLYSPCTPRWVGLISD